MLLLISERTPNRPIRAAGGGGARIEHSAKLDLHHVLKGPSEHFKLSAPETRLRLLFLAIVQSDHRQKEKQTHTAPVRVLAFLLLVNLPPPLTCGPIIYDPYHL